MMTTSIELFETFEATVRRAPGRIVLRHRGETAGPEEGLTAAALLDRVMSAARDLRESGPAPGQIALPVRGIGAPFVIDLLAVWALGAVALPADPNLTGAELDELRATFPPDAPLPPGTALIKLTSGSTGRPRGIATTADQLVADTRHIIEGMRIGPDEVNIAAIPLSHSYGLASLIMPLVLQGSPLLLVAAPLPELLAEALSIEEPASFPGVPFLFDLLARPDCPPVRRRGLKCCISAGAPLRARTAAAFRARIGLPVRAFYGTSETGGITYDTSPEGDAAIRAEGCVGTQLPGVRVSVEGEEGRVVVRGLNIASGYVGAAGADASTGPADGQFRERAFLTGDTGRLVERESGTELHLTGRLAALVNISGRKVNPREVERALLELPGVHDAAVFGVPDEARGESLVACLVADPTVTREQALAHLRKSLAPYKLPRRVIILPDLPRTERGKVDVEAVRQTLLRDGE